jgi:hypothetical protein
MGTGSKARPEMTDYSPPSSDNVVRTPSTHWIGGWVGLSAGLDTEARGKIFASAGDRTAVAQPVVRYKTDWATFSPAQSMICACCSLAYQRRSTWASLATSWDTNTCSKIHLYLLHTVILTMPYNFVLIPSPIFLLFLLPFLYYIHTNTHSSLPWSHTE